MQLFDGYISAVNALLKGKDFKSFAYETPRLGCAEKNNVIFIKDTAFELGAGQFNCVSTLAVSSKMSFNNETLVFGEDIKDIKSDCPFAKIVLVEIEDVDEDSAFERIKELERVRYRFCPENFMSRASAINMREQIRVSKKAVKNKLSFADYGNAVIGEYLKNPIVKSVRLIIITADDFDYDGLYKISEKIKDTVSALNHIFDNVLFDCKSCNLKEICDEVEGMKELHMKTAMQKTNLKE